MSKIHVSGQCGTKMVFIPMSTALPFRGKITWNKTDIYVSVQCGAKNAFIPFRAQLPMWGKITWD